MRILAHGIGVVRDLPIPAIYFFVGATLVLAVSFVLLLALWRRPLLEAHAEGRCLPDGLSRILLSLPVRGVLGAFSVGVFVLTLATALFGTRISLLNFAPTFVYVVFWLGIPLLSVLFGNVWSALSPWRAIADVAVWILELGGREARPVLEWSGKWGRFPGAAALFAFVALELTKPQPDYPRTLAIAIALYSYWAWAGMAVYGREAWTRFGEGFAVMFELLSRIAPFAAREGRVVIRWPFTGLAGDDRTHGALLFVAVMLGSTSFDGFSRTSSWQDLVTNVRGNLADSSQRTVDLAVMFVNLGGLLFFIAVILASYLAAVAAAEKTRWGPPLARSRLRASTGPDRRGVHGRPLLHAGDHPGAVRHPPDLGPVRAWVGSLRHRRLRAQPRDRHLRDRLVRAGGRARDRPRRGARDRARPRCRRVPRPTHVARGPASDARPHGPVHVDGDVAAYPWLVAHGGVIGAIAESAIALGVLGVLGWAWLRERRRGDEPGVEEHGRHGDRRRQRTDPEPGQPAPDSRDRDSGEDQRVSDGP